MCWALLMQEPQPHLPSLLSPFRLQLLDTQAVGVRREKM